MKTSIDWLEETKIKLGISSDYALADALEITRSQMSRYRLKKDRLSNIVAARVAEILEIDAMIVIASVSAEKARTPKERAKWEFYITQLLACQLILIGLFSSGYKSDAVITSQESAFNHIYITRIKCVVAKL